MTDIADATKHLQPRPQPDTGNDGGHGPSNHPACPNTDPERQKQIDKLIRNYEYRKGKLLQITRKNRSVQFKRIYQKHNLDLADLESLQPDTIRKTVSKAIKNISATLNDKKDEGEKQNILSDSIKGDDADVGRARLRTLSRNLDQIEEETGQQVGYLGFPFLQGNIERDFYIRGPVVLFPVSLQYKRQARNSGWFLHLEDKRPILNGALIAALKTKGMYGMENHEDTFDAMIEEIAEAKAEDPTGYFFDKVHSWLGTMLEIDRTKNHPEPVKISTLGASDLADLQDHPLHLVNHMLVGNFPQADSGIYKDYEDLIKSADLLDAGLAGSLLDVEDSDAEVPGPEHAHTNLNDTADIKLNLVLPSDPSQDEVIVESKRSHLVVRGPPGTGKSQVIVNLIADALTNKKNVLVVCQKRAALEVVKQRLEREDLGRYAVFLEKEINDRAKMYRQLAELVEKTPYPIHESQLDLGRISSKIDECVRYLSGLGNALKKHHFGGVTMQELYVRADPHYKPVLDLDSAGFAPDWRDLDSQIGTISRLEADFKELEDENHPWFGRRNFAEFDMARIRRMQGDLKELVSLAPDCLLASSPEDQSMLHSLFEKCLGNTGFLKGLKNRGVLNKIQAILKSGKVTEGYVSENFKGVKNGLKFWSVFPGILSSFGNEKQDKLRSMTADAASLAAYLSGMQEALRDPDRMVQLDKSKNEHEIIFKVLQQAMDTIDAGRNWAETIRQEVYYNWIGKIYRESPILVGMPESDYAEKRGELERLMEEKRQMVRRVIQHDIENSIRLDGLYGKRKTPEQKKMVEFKKELNRKRKVKPIRRLFEEYGTYMFKIAPCWLASPEAVSNVFPLKEGLFDLVIVDEASQLAVERALPFLYRAERAVIAGDDKQLPPFDLFQAKEELPDEDEDEITAEKSLLDLAVLAYRQIMLSWHYRSEYQELIDFSNHAFYEGRLNVAPRPDSDPWRPPIRWIQSNGTWNNNANIVEAERVVDEIKNIWEHGLDRDGRYPSIGIITFNERQQDCIKDAIEKRLESDPEFNGVHTAAREGARKDDLLFVKNIENVQGDERDVIVFSVGYAKDEDGMFANRFGLINQRGGEKRLNVAITRARREMVIVSSISPNDIKPSKNVGPRLLQKFLEYAKRTYALDEEGQRQVLADINPDMQRNRQSEGMWLDSEFEEQVYRKLEERGYKVKTQIGESGYRIDLAIVHPDDGNRYILGIECDGATFHSSKSVKERDILRQRFLEGKGWRIERIWSRRWWVNSDKEVDRIDARVKDILAREVAHARDDGS